MKQNGQRNLAIGYLIIGVLLLIYNWFKFNHTNQHDILIGFIVFVVPQSRIGIVFSMVLFIFAIIHFIFHYKKIQLKTNLSIITTIGIILGIVLFFRIRIWSPGGMSREATVIALPMGLFFFCSAIVLFIINVIISSAKKHKG